MAADVLPTRDILAQNCDIRNASYLSFVQPSKRNTSSFLPGMESKTLGLVWWLEIIRMLFSVLACWVKRSAFMEVTYAEIEGLAYALQSAEQRSWSQIVVEGDSHMAINQLHNDIGRGDHNT
ncbi:hypothetical protein O6P43_009996 [Quillaja saponaria]|uniref:RNase H type-1 domain-containing protein n=1 Tax=Quillaja saponaria TaxID=32244 RepID=A0AAD7VDQ3_QUISA|nr:hypothetical protein O6P43_009996 [Quillaja saponaria]